MLIKWPNLMPKTVSSISSRSSILLLNGTKRIDNTCARFLMVEIHQKSKKIRFSRIMKEN